MRLGNFKTPALISSVLMVPFLLLELVNGRILRDGFPVVLFGFMWFLILSFFVILIPTVRSPADANGAMQKFIGPSLRVILLILIAGMWTGLIHDQLPCFLGVPNCD